MKTLLVATDFSLPANNAVEYAANLAKEMDAALILFNVYKMSIHVSNSISSSESINNIMKNNETKLIELSNDIGHRFNIHVSWVLEKNDPIESLKNYIETHSVDLVVMGIENNLTEYKLFGNTTTSAIKLMQFPLLIIPDNIQYVGIKKVLYSCDSSYLKDHCDLTILKQFVKDLDASLSVFHVITDNSSKDKNEQLEQKMDTIFHDLAHDYCYVNNKNVGEGITAGLEKYSSDLLVMIPHKIGFFESLFKGSHTNQMTVRTKVALLVIPNEAAC